MAGLGLRRPKRGSERARMEPAVLVACFCVAAAQSAWTIVIPVLPALADDMGANATAIGLAVAVFGLGRLLVNVPAGILSDRLDPRWLMFAGMGGVTASQFAIFFAPNLDVLLVLRFLAGVAGGVALTSGTVLVATLADEERRGHALSVMQGVQLSASGLGPAIGGLVAALFGNRAPFLACGLFAIVVCLLGTRTLLAVPRGRLNQKATDEVPDAPAVSTWRLLTDRSYLAVCGIGFSIFLHRFGGVQSIVPLIGYTIVGISVAHMGVLLGLVTLLNFALLPFVGGISDRRGRKRMIVPGILIATVTFPLYAADDSVWLFTLVTLVAGVAMSVSAPVPSAYVVDIAPPTARGRALGFYRTCGDLAAVIGPVTLGFLVDHGNYRVAVIAMAAVMLVAVAAFALVGRETRGPRAQAS